MDKLSKLTITVLVFFFFVLPVDAKVLPRFRKASSGSSSGVSGVTVWAKLRADRQAVFVTFGNLNLAQKVSYSLMYDTNGETQGVGGSLDLSSGSLTRELVFGTASNGVYRYHNNVTNAKLEITSVLKNGQKRIKKFRIKV